MVPLARPIRGFEDSTETLRVKVTMEDIGTELLFAASEPLGVRLRTRGRLERRINVQGAYNRQIRLMYKPPGAIQYEFVTRSGVPTREELLAVGDPPVPPLALGPYVQRSEALSEDVTALAERITAGAETRLERVEAVMTFLQGFRYTLELESSARVRAGADPLEGFLFDTKAGHCEYFATAMAVLLREGGVPTRNVNGYYGAHWNELGGFYVVRQADAHSWVEVHFGRLGWVTFDPTPPTGRLAGDDAPWWPAAANVIDAVRSTYLEYIIDFNLGKQIAMLQELGVRPGRGYHSRTPIWRRHTWLMHAAWIAMLGLVGLRLFQRSGTRRGERPEARIYARLLRVLERRGLPRRVHESPSRYAARLARDGVREAETLARFAELYETIRFGPPLGRDRLEALREAARQVRRSR